MPAKMMKPPTESDVESVVASEGAALDKVIDMSTPSGRYSNPRLKTFESALNAAMKSIQPQTAVIASVVDVPKNLEQDVRQLPKELVAAYLTVSGAFEKFCETPDGEAYETASGELEFPDISSLTDDGALAMAAGILNKASKVKPFARWAASQVPEKPVATPVAAAAPVAAKPDMTPELMSLFG